MQPRGRGADTPFDRSRVRFVLVEPRHAGNVGAAARALANFGFQRLTVVRPTCDPRGADARRMAVGAGDVLDGAEVVAGLDAALAGAGTVIGTTSRTGKHRRPFRRLDTAAPAIAALARAGDVVVVFGREDRGLEVEELDRCTHLAYLPTDERQSSLNLAQSVVLVAYELALASEPAVEPRDADPPASDEEREAMYAHLRRALATIGFLHEDSADPLMRRIRRLIGRADPTSVEVALLRGIARQALWAAGRAGLPTIDREG